MKWLGFIAVLMVLLIPMPVMAIGVSPFNVNVDVSANSYKELTFTVTGSSVVDISLEGIPLAVEPSHISVVDGKITIKILGSPSVPSGTYEGYLVLLESGQQVGAGVKVSLTVHYTNNQSVALTTTVLSPSGGGGSGGGYYGGGYGAGGDIGLTYPQPNPPTQPSASFNPMPTYVPPVVTNTPPFVSNPPVGEAVPLASAPSVSPFAVIAIIGGLLLIYGLYHYRRRRQQ
jgi:hypothetical protein